MKTITPGRSLAGITAGITDAKVAGADTVRISRIVGNRPLDGMNPVFIRRGIQVMKRPPEAVPPRMSIIFSCFLRYADRIRKPQGEKDKITGNRLQTFFFFDYNV
jgi:hypothetical protein